MSKKDVIAQRNRIIGKSLSERQEPIFQEVLQALEDSIRGCTCAVCRSIPVETYINHAYHVAVKEANNDTKD
jgi:hypothetical protein